MALLRPTTPQHRQEPHHRVKHISRQPPERRHRRAWVEQDAANLTRCQPRADIREWLAWPAIAFVADAVTGKATRFRHRFAAFQEFTQLPSARAADGRGRRHAQFDRTADVHRSFGHHARQCSTPDAEHEDHRRQQRRAPDIARSAPSAHHAPPHVGSAARQPISISRTMLSNLRSSDGALPAAPCDYSPPRVSASWRARVTQSSCAATAVCCSRSSIRFESACRLCCSPADRSAINSSTLCLCSSA